MATALLRATPAPQISKAPSARRYYAPELDALRLLAFLLVFCRHVVVSFGLAKHQQQVSPSTVAGFHEAAPQLANGLSPTWLLAQSLAQSFDFGVCLFFFLSSFLITRLLLLELESTGTLAIRDFYVRRSLRIWPLYFVFLLSVGAVSLLLPALHVTLPRFLSTLFFVANVPVLLQGWNGSPIEPLWSVSVEEQFYLVWPWVARIGKSGIVWLSSILVVIPIVVLCYLGSRQGATNTQIWPNSLVQCLFFAGGALTAAGTKIDTRERTRALRIVMLISGFASWLLASAWCHVVQTSSPGPVRLVCGYLLVLLGTALIFTAFLGSNPRLFPKLVLYLGKTSYGLYVFHVLCLQSVLWFSGMALARYGKVHMPLGVLYLITSTLALVLTMVSAHLSYKYLETPFLKLKARFTVIDSRPA